LFYLVADHGVFLRVAKELLEVRDRVVVLQLTEHVRHLMPQQRRRIAKH
jgi:hypothetical protein